MKGEDHKLVQRQRQTKDEVLVGFIDINMVEGYSLQSSPKLSVDAIDSLVFDVFVLAKCTSSFATLGTVSSSSDHLRLNVDVLC